MKDPGRIIQKLDAYFIPKTNTSVRRHIFNSRIQLPQENFDGFLNDLRKLAADCEFSTLKNGLIKDQIVFGIRDKKTKDRLLREPDLDLTKAINICKAAEQTELHIKQLVDPTNELKIGEIKRSNMKDRRNELVKQHRVNEKDYSSRQDYSSRPRGRDFQGRSATADRSRMATPFQPSQRKCSKCGYQHAYRECPAHGKQCSKCKNFNHYATQCRFNTSLDRGYARNQNNTLTFRSRRNNDSNNDKRVENLDAVDENIEEYVLGSIENKEISGDWYETIKIENCNKVITCKLDTGAHVNVIPKYIFANLGLDDLLNETKIIVRNYDGEKLNVVGTCILKIQCNNMNNITICNNRH